MFFNSHIIAGLIVSIGKTKLNRSAEYTKWCKDF